jgi:hypothetical protein
MINRARRGVDRGVSLLVAYGYGLISCKAEVLLQLSCRDIPFNLGGGGGTSQPD